MTVFFYTLKRLLKNKVLLIFMLLLPLVTIIPTTQITVQSTKISIGVVNRDDTAFTKDLLNRLGKNFSIVNVTNVEIKGELESAAITYAIEIPKGFTNDIINGKSPKINGLGLEEKDCSKVVGAAVDGFVYPSKLIAAKTHGNSEAFYSAISKIPPTEAVAQKKDNKMPFKLIVQCMFMMSIFAATVIITDKESKTFYRSFNAPVSMRSYMIQSILCFLLISILQIAVIYTVTVYGMGVDPGKNPLYVLLVLAVTSLSAVALGVAVSSVCKSTAQATGIGLGIVVVMCMFGGAWGMSPTKPLIIGTAKILPFYWSSDALSKVIGNNALDTVTGDLLILLAFSAVFFLVGTWRKSDIER